MKLVFLESKSLGEDISLDKFNNLGDVVIYDNTMPEEIEERIKDADIVIANKAPLTGERLKNAANLKLICLTATGTNNVDFSYTNANNIVVTNVKGYSTNSVAQHTFAMMFYLLEKLHHYDTFVKSGEYENYEIFSYFNNYFSELYGKRWGIIGLGEIGLTVARIARSFGCDVCYYSTSGKNNNSEFNRAELDEILKTSDIVSVHSPLNADTLNLIGKNELSMMKKSAIIINVGRGGIIDEAALAEALNNGTISGAGIDVLTKEPIARDNPLNAIKDSTKLIITPHMAWATVEARKRLMDEVYANIEAYYDKKERNVVH
ncbi:MAG: D-2-hydroxyacid dehydrogenase [Lachnospiraceae bacterium]|nr:D-2-hydroxyacid dehydrogenase [Lachnospiraceae bacterium]